MIYTNLYDIKLVILSFIVAIITSFVTLKIIFLIDLAQANEKKWWALTGAFILALGIWSLHFIGMLGYHFHMPVHYHLKPITESFFILFIGCLSLFFMLGKEKPSMWWQALTVIVMGIALSAGHYMGMRSLELTGSYQVRVVLFIIVMVMALNLSASITFIANYIVNMTGRKTIMQIIGSLFIGLGLSSVHYGTMESVILTETHQTSYDGRWVTIHHLSVSTNMLAYALGIAVIMIILATMVFTYTERVRVEQKLRLSKLAFKKEFEKAQQDLNNTLHESYALRRTIIDNLPIGIVVIDQNRKVIALNRSFHEMFHLEMSIKDMIGKDAKKYYEYFYKNSLMEKINVKELIRKRQPFVEEIELVDERVMERSYFPFYMDQELKGHLWTVEDITERKRMEEANRRAKEEAEQANEAKTRFLSHMSHELRTPLNSILGFSQLLELEETLSQKQKKFVEIIQSGGRHLLTLITDILDLSRIEAGKLTIVKERIQLGPLIEECVQIVVPSAAKHSIDIRHEWEQHDEIIVSADPKRVKQILLNLLDNAIKYNREQGSVVISLERKAGDLFVHILDSGIGIPATEQKNIFEPFYRIEAVAKDGAGIGLSLALQLTHAMGGTMGVESHPYKGSDFWFSLPIAADKKAVAGQRQIENEPSNLNDSDLTILYIEDNVLNLELVEEILGSIEGIVLLSELTGHAGLAIAYERQPDIILVDINLPDLNGMEVMERLKADERTKAIPVIAVSANTMAEQMELARAKGFADYISKPIDVPKFLNVIGKYL